VWTVEFVSGTDEEIAVPLVYLRQVMGDVVDGVDEQERADRPGKSGGPRDVVDCAECVRGRADRDEFCLFVDGSVKIVPIERAGLAIHFHNTKRAAALTSKCLPGTDIRMMVEFCDDNLIAGGDLRQKCARDVEGKRRCIGAEHDFFRGAAEKLGHCLAGAGHHCVGFSAGG